MLRPLDSLLYINHRGVPLCGDSTLSSVLGSFDPAEGQNTAGLERDSMERGRTRNASPRLMVGRFVCSPYELKRLGR